jgi:hypothetical protein
LIGIWLGDPGERNIGLGAAKLRSAAAATSRLPGHAGGGREHAVGADEIAALPDASRESRIASS